MSGNCQGKCQGILNRLKCGNPDYAHYFTVVLFQ